jgi:acylphosphatase
MAKTRVHLYISGLVQGVFFRQNTKRQAQSRGVTGWVRNLADGRVEAVLEGEESAVDAVVEWCRRGPSYARVQKLEVDSEEFKGEFSGFQTR